ncbi:hypothetical protein SAMN04487935_3645 [Flavobacterium noncentrifugens]|uniref:Uncharacterized protein n=1 Tax=Flavobacterium noncentrifugens TaxID=1128970 RepID=A0A1G9CT39_9FLAO|nr:hypothetical protein SAMN04487935_3645 [Flavobacterium noncentrifugens]
MKEDFGLKNLLTKKDLGLDLTRVDIMDLEDFPANIIRRPISFGNYKSFRRCFSFLF